MKHTEGPWQVQQHEPGSPSNNGLGGYSIQTREEGIAYNVARPENATLIAAAPEMYEALHDAYGALGLLNVGDQQTIVDNAQSIIVAALAKAEGR